MILENQAALVLGTVFFAVAIVHSFSIGFFKRLSEKFEAHSLPHSLFHLLSEVEIVFGLWGFVLYLILGMLYGFGEVIKYHSELRFTEPVFVFCILVVAASRPVLWLVQEIMESISLVISKSLRISHLHTNIAVILILGPLLGSFITEPAAMTVSAVLIHRILKSYDRWLLYSFLAVLFVNVSIGGALTPFAAPPILMVAHTWNWNFEFVLNHFGWKCAAAVVINSLGLVAIFSKSIRKNCSNLREFQSSPKPISKMLIFAHYLFLVAIVMAARYPSMALALLLFFLALASATPKYQEQLRIRESLLVGFFLAGLIVFGPFQKWWLEPILRDLNEMVLYPVTVLLTAVTDNAALTYMGSQVSNLGDNSKYFLVAGAIAGGGLTLIANAPNAAGYGILHKHFKEGFRPWALLVAAIPPTIVAILCL